MARIPQDSKIEGQCAVGIRGNTNIMENKHNPLAGVGILEKHQTSSQAVRLIDAARSQALFCLRNKSTGPIVDHQFRHRKHPSSSLHK